MWDSFPLGSDCRLGLLAFWAEALFFLHLGLVLPFIFKGNVLTACFLLWQLSFRKSTGYADKHMCRASSRSIEKQEQHCDLCKCFLKWTLGSQQGGYCCSLPSLLSTGRSVERLSQPASTRLMSRINKIPNCNFGSLDCKLDVSSGMWTKQQLWLYCTQTLKIYTGQRPFWMPLWPLDCLCLGGRFTLHLQREMRVWPQKASAAMQLRFDCTS